MSVTLAIAIFDAFFFPLMVWVWFSVTRTGEDRMKILEAMRHRPMTGMAIMTAFDAVTFHQHMKARVLRRDPWALYDPIVLDAIKNPRVEMIGMMQVGPSDAPPAIH